jgi:hypothetical protein
MDTLIFLAAEAKAKDSWLDFSQFCALRGQGVRAAAMERLDKFLRAAVAWPLEERLAFSKWLLQRSQKFHDDRVVLPHFLRERLIVPTLRQWNEALPNEADPHLWLGLLRCDDPSHHLDKALSLDPSCEQARRALVDWILSDVEYNQHELPSFYINDPTDDLKALKRALELASDRAAEAWASSALREIGERRARAESWIASRAVGSNVVLFPGPPSHIIPPSGE